MRLGSLCTGFGGLDLAAEMVLGPLDHVWYAEHDPAVTKAGNPVPQYAAQVAAAHWPDVPNLGDLTAINWHAVPKVDLWTAGFPCTDVSPAGRRAGLKPGTRSGIWSHIAYGISIIRPRLVLLENVEGLLSAPAHSDVEPCPWCLGDIPPDLVVRALGVVLADLADLGFDAEWTTVSASDVGAPHRRRRVFIVAWPADCPPSGNLLSGRLGVDVAGSDRLTLLPTPNAALGRGTGTPSRKTAAARIAAGKRFLDDAVALLPTPAARDWKSGESNIMDRNGRPLNEVVVNYAHADRWGNYAAAICRWERIIGRPAPAPTEPGTKGQPRLAPRFVEWMLGLPDGWVTDHVPRNGALKVLGNGVLPLQGAYAYTDLLQGIVSRKLAAVAA